jgi:hypothetical protein
MPETLKRQLRWIYLLPIIHLCACFVIALARIGSGWEYLIKIDYPISVFVVSALFSFDHPLILFGTVGTLWWYALSWLAVTWGTRLIAHIGRGHDLSRGQGEAKGRN